MADKQDGVSPPGVAQDRRVYARHQRAGSVERDQLPGRGFVSHGGATPCAENTAVAPIGIWLRLVDEDRAAGAQVLHDDFVVNDLVAHVDGSRIARRASLERQLDRANGALDPSAESARRSEQHGERHQLYIFGVRCLVPRQLTPELNPPPSHSLRWKNLLTPIGPQR